jgi:hypothetical protein
MTARRLLLLFTVTAVAVAAAATTAASAHLTIGIGDEHPQSFGDPLLARLRLRKARLVTGWDTALRPGAQRSSADQYLAAARRAGYDVLVSFAHSGNAGRTRTLPSAAAYAKGVKAFVKRYPQVRTYSPWDEVNTCSEPTCHAPKAAATYYRTLRSACRRCTVVAAELLDTDYREMRAYLRQFLRYAGRPTPRLWALHPYSDANRFRTIGTRTLLAIVPGTVWFTEVGGLYSFPPSFPRSTGRQVRAVKQMEKLATSSARIQRLYYYSWQGGGTFDAGLTWPSGSARPAYATFAAWVARQRGR